MSPADEISNDYDNNEYADVDDDYDDESQNRMIHKKIYQDQNISQH